MANHRFKDMKRKHNAKTEFGLSFIIRSIRNSEMSAPAIS